MKINTKLFGGIEIKDDDIINFPDGILGFEEYKRFIIINDPDEEVPFKTLQCIDETNIGFIIINPFLFNKDYDFTLSQSVLQKLKIETEKDVLVYSIVVIPEDISRMTANLSGPIIINTKTRLGKQIILDDKKYKTKHYILEELKKIGKEE